MMMNISDLIRDTIVGLCKTNRPYNGQVEIDGIICISGPKEGQQLVIKVHECLESFGKETVETWINRKSLCNEAQNCKSPLIKSENMESSLVSPNSEGDHENATSDIQAESRESDLNQIAKSLAMAGTAGEMSNSEIFSNKISVSKHCLPMTLECKLCAKSFLDQESMEVHNELSHNLYTCHSCLKTFTSRSNLERHSRLHTGHKPYSCTICDKAFSRKDHLSNHMTKHAFKCSSCSKKFSDCVTLATHFSYDHRLSLTHICQFCNEGFSNSPAYEDHLRSHQECQCSGMDRVPSSLSNGQKRFSCQVCPFSTADALAFYRHRLSHMFNNKSQYSCILCNKPFDNLKSFMEHSMEHQNSMASQTLHINWLQHFSNHYKSFLMTGNSGSYHLSDINQVPDVYLKELLHKDSNHSFKDFNEIEHSEKRMKRKLEHPGFVDTGSLKYHKRSSNYLFPASPGVTMGPCKLKINLSDGHLSDTFNSPADCFNSIEDSVFEDSPINLKMEKTSESDDQVTGPHQCGVCQLWFNSFEVLDNHCLEDHNRSACMFCSKTFAQRANRDRHLCLHTGKKPYSCSDCNEKFSRGDKLKMHRIKVHGAVYPSRMRDADNNSWTDGNFLRNQDFQSRMSPSPTDPNSIETNNSIPCDDSCPQIKALEGDSKLQQDPPPSE